MKKVLESIHPKRKCELPSTLGRPSAKKRVRRPSASINPKEKLKIISETTLIFLQDLKKGSKPKFLCRVCCCYCLFVIRCHGVPNWPRTCFVDKAILELRDLPASGWVKAIHQHIWQTQVFY